MLKDFFKRILATSAAPIFHWAWGVVRGLGIDIESQAMQHALSGN